MNGPLNLTAPVSSMGHELSGPFSAEPVTSGKVLLSRTLTSKQADRSSSRAHYPASRVYCAQSSQSET